MKKPTLLIVFILSLVLSACGGGDDGGGGVKPKKAPEKIVDPWAGIDSGSLPEDIGEDRNLYRVLEFSDDFAISYDGRDRGPNGHGDEEVCRRELVDEDGIREYYEVCMSLGGRSLLCHAPGQRLRLASP